MSNKKRSSRRIIRIPSKFDNTICDLNNSKSNTCNRERIERDEVNSEGNDDVSNGGCENLGNEEGSTAGNPVKWMDSEFPTLNETISKKTEYSVHSVNVTGENNKENEETLNIDSQSGPKDVNNENKTEIPTGKNDEGIEVAIFDEELIKIGRMFVNANGVYFFKFRQEEEVKFVLGNGPWMVNNKPLYVQKWRIDLNLDKSEPKSLQVWVKLINVPMEAWTTKGISAIASCLGKPLIMDDMTTRML
ncbi:RNA-directed DNA polymerase, eukaryota, reverse transcriptase zinc-binding domain protein [Tanacetum coccineum]